jgi:hypothetical protein
MDSPIEDAIAKAKAQASRLPVIINARKLTMSDLKSSSLDVESWLQVDKYGLHLDKSQEAARTFHVRCSSTPWRTRWAPPASAPTRDQIYLLGGVR